MQIGGGELFLARERRIMEIRKISFWDIICERGFKNVALG